MKTMWNIIVFLMVIQSLSCAPYGVPEIQIDILKPQGLRVSIPDEEGIKIFSFHANLNYDIKQQEDSDILGKVLQKSPDNRWTYETTDQYLEEGDTINYWYYVQKDGVGYQSAVRSFIVGKDSVPDASSTPIGLPLTETTTPQALRSNTSEPVIPPNQDSNSPDGGLVLGGNLPDVCDGKTQQLVNFILWEKLNLSTLHSRSSVKNADGSITFYLASDKQKEEVLEAAKKHLLYSTIFIVDPNPKIL